MEEKEAEKTSRQKGCERMINVFEIEGLFPLRWSRVAFFQHLIPMSLS